MIRGNTPEAKAKAEQLLADIKAGADFAELAKAPEDPGNAAKGGDSLVCKGRMVKPFQDALDALPNTGRLSALVVTTTFGYHIIRLDGRKPGSQRPFEEVEKNCAPRPSPKPSRSAPKLVRELRAEGKR